LEFYKTVFLDLDNTLFSFNDMYEQVAYHAIEQTVGFDKLPTDIADFYKQFRRLADALYVEYESGKQTIDCYRTLRWIQTFGHYQIPISDSKMNELNQFILNHYLDFVTPYPGSKEFLVELKKRVRVGLITNGPEVMQRAKLIRMEYLDFFDEQLVITSETVGKSKPDPQIFHYALNKAGISPNEALHIGDSIHHDIQGAIASGVDSALIHMENHQLEVKPTFHFQDFYEAASTLQLKQ
jgi:HAD superfamily hydrolase (TIGR01509 family)